MGVFPVCACVHHMLAPTGLEEGIRAPRTGVTHSCELPRGSSESSTWILGKSSRRSSLLIHLSVLGLNLAAKFLVASHESVLC